MSSEPLDASAVPRYLQTTHELVEKLNRGDQPLEAIVSAIATLEHLVRTNPADKILLTDEPLDPFPITKYVVGTFEDLAHKTNGEVSFGLAAVQRLGVLVSAVRALEEKTQELERRLVELGDDSSG